MDMVEKVARAIWAAREASHPRFTQRRAWDDLDIATGAKAVVLLMAHAAIEAMRDPTPEMLEAFALMAADYHYPTAEAEGLASWQVMIDAALPSKG